MIDYSKPGKTAPGTKHTPVRREQKRTWLDVVPAPRGRNLPKPREEPQVEPEGPSRRQRRYEERWRARRQRTGQRRFNEQQRRTAFRNDTLQAQRAVLEAGPDAPGNAHRYRNVANSLLRRHGAEIQQMIEADA